MFMHIPMHTHTCVYNHLIGQRQRPRPRRRLHRRHFSRLLLRLLCSLRTRHCRLHIDFRRRGPCLRNRTQFFRLRCSG